MSDGRFATLYSDLHRSHVGNRLCRMEITSILAKEILVLAIQHSSYCYGSSFLRHRNRRSVRVAISDLGLDRTNHNPFDDGRGLERTHSLCHCSHSSCCVLRPFVSKYRSLDRVIVGFDFVELGDNCDCWINSLVCVTTQEQREKAMNDVRCKSRTPCFAIKSSGIYYECNTQQLRLAFDGPLEWLPHFIDHSLGR